MLHVDLDTVKKWEDVTEAADDKYIESIYNISDLPTDFLKDDAEDEFEPQPFDEDDY